MVQDRSRAVCGIFTRLYGALCCAACDGATAPLHSTTVLYAAIQCSMLYKNPPLGFKYTCHTVLPMR
eukprot:15362009-Ditylum_brightwellii.AAC.1